MEKEEILKRHLSANDNHSEKHIDQFTRFLVYNAMDECADQVSKSKDEEIRLLKEENQHLKTAIDIEIDHHKTDVQILSGQVESLTEELNNIRANDLTEADHYCGNCKSKLTLVRPGSHQCDNPNCN